jgi:hypothetical protein
LNPVARLFAGDRLIATDDDSGEGQNARIVARLEPGTYRVMVQDAQGRAMVGQLLARRLPSITPVVSITPGQSTPVQIPAASNPRDGIRAIVLEVGQPDLFQIDAMSGNGRDAEVAILREGVEMHRDSDSGEGLNGRIRAQLEPGRYEIRIWDYSHAATTIQVAVERAATVDARPQPQVENVGAISSGQPMVVEIPAASDPVAGTRGLTLTVTEQGVYQLGASGPQGVDAEMSIVLDGRELQRDSDSGEGVNARIVRELTPGTYEVRVWEYRHRGAAITVSVSLARE